MGQHRLDNKAVVQQFLNETIASIGPLSREVTTHIFAESVWCRVLGLATPVQSVIPGKKSWVWTLWAFVQETVWSLDTYLTSSENVGARRGIFSSGVFFWGRAFARWYYLPHSQEPYKGKLTFSLTGYLEDLSTMLKLPSWEDKEQLRDHPNSYNHRTIKNKENFWTLARQKTKVFKINSTCPDPHYCR